MIFRKAILFFLILAVLIAFPISVFALGFETEEVYNSVFVIHSGQSLGSGFAVGKNYIITNAHVIDDVENVKVESYNGEIQDGTIVSIDNALDIAVIGISGVSFVPLEIADLQKISVGDNVYAIGAPNSLAYTLTKGIVSSKDRVAGGQKYIQTDAAINSGNSGGPLLNDDGAVVGVNSYKLSHSEGIGLAIPISTVVSFLENKKINVNDNYTESKNDNQPESQYINEKSTVDEIESTNSQPPALMIALAVGLTVSVLLNIILIIVLMYRKKKNVYSKIDASERTDFDIDILD